MLIEIKGKKKFLLAIKGTMKYGQLIIRGKNGKTRKSNNIRE